MRNFYFCGTFKFKFIITRKCLVFVKKNSVNAIHLKMSADKYNEIEKNLPQQTTRADKIQKLKEAEKFIEIDEGKFECQGCGYIYDPSKGDKFAGIVPAIQFSELPDNFNCPACRSSKSQFKSVKKVIIGFVENQKYGLGGNSMTSNQKNLAIFGSLAIFFFLLLSGYFLE